MWRRESMQNSGESHADRFRDGLKKLRSADRFAFNRERAMLVEQRMPIGVGSVNGLVLVDYDADIDQTID
jgi:hypothetical protein